MSELIETHERNGVEFIVLRGELGDSVLWNVGGSYEEGWDEFLADFEIDDEDYLGDPKEDHYQGTTFTRLIKRRADGAVFGQTVWRNPGIDSMEGQRGESYVEDLGLPWDWEGDEPEPVVFFPVKEFVRVGFEVDKSGLLD